MIVSDCLFPACSHSLRLVQALSIGLVRQKEENLQVKLSIIEELKELVESGDDANKSYTEFKKLQQQWNETKLVPQGKVNELWKNYQLYVEKFYDFADNGLLVKIMLFRFFQRFKM